MILVVVCGSGTTMFATIEVLSCGRRQRKSEVGASIVVQIGEEIGETESEVSTQDLRVFNVREGRAVTFVDGRSVHKNSIRAICYGAQGKLFVSAGDDKLVKIWITDSWQCIYTISAEKRVTVVPISNDGQYVNFADKFGVVWVVELEGLHESSTMVDKKPAPILSHYCSIITSLDFSPDGKFIVSADRVFKFRVTVFPEKPLDGAHDIQSFCLGHTEFVSCFSFTCSEECPGGFLFLEVAIQQFAYGIMHLDLYLIPVKFCEVGAGAGLLQSNGSEEEILPAVTDLRASQDGSLVAVDAVQNLGVLLLGCSFSAKALSVARKITISGEAFIPTCLSSSSTSELLWLVMGVSNLQGSDSPSLARVRAISCFWLNENVSKAESEYVSRRRPFLNWRLRGTLFL